MMDLCCESAIVDVVSWCWEWSRISRHTLPNGTWTPTESAHKSKGRNCQQNDLMLKDNAITQSIEELHLDRVDAVALTPDTLDFAIKENKYVFVDFYASWHSPCSDLASTWETLAEVMLATGTETYYANFKHDYTEEDYNHALKVEQAVVIGKVDCVNHHQLCMDQVSQKKNRLDHNDEDSNKSPSASFCRQICLFFLLYVPVGELLFQALLFPLIILCEGTSGPRSIPTKLLATA